METSQTFSSIRRALTFSIQNKKSNLVHTIFFLSFFLSSLYFSRSIDFPGSGLFGSMLVMVFLPLTTYFTLSLYRYHLQDREFSWKHFFSKKKKELVLLFFSGILTLGIFLLLWAFLSVSFALSTIPTLGVIFSIFFSSLPFLFYLVMGIFYLCYPVVLFLLLPQFTANISSFTKKIVLIRDNLLKNFGVFYKYLISSALPFIFFSLFCYLIFCLSKTMIFQQDAKSYFMVYNLFLVIPISILFAPFISFFFALSLEFSFTLRKQICI